MGTLTARLVLAVALATPAAAWAADPAPPVGKPAAPARSPPQTAEQDLIGCTQLVIEGAMYDYRARKTPERLWGYNDNQKYHFDPAVDRMRQGEYPMSVIADLDFLLRRWPNHYAALQALAQYERGGGKRYQFPTTACYFARARQFAPDDVNVYLNEGYYFWKKGEKQRAQAAWEAALTVDPDSADAHYNLGLIFFDAGQYQAASQHAQAAYAEGYPLPGLRRKLEKIGQWRNAPAVSSVPEASR
jgi:tetratricopeptide (TPR) repeat protein